MRAPPRTVFLRQSFNTLRKHRYCCSFEFLIHTPQAHELVRRRSKAARQTQTILKSPTGPKGGVVPSETRLSNQGVQRTKGACALNQHHRPRRERHVLPLAIDLTRSAGLYPARISGETICVLVQMTHTIRTDIQCL